MHRAQSRMFLGFSWSKTKFCLFSGFHQFDVKLYDVIGRSYGNLYGAYFGGYGNWIEETKTYTLVSNAAS